ncbi:MAG: hypothetical protein EWV67_10995 [Microcystis sp. M_QC_C_20170808_M2Col]|nr:MAG: hypothetical protein EWV67_10995 [Microcystis sp. M_QC_C_20170808_M2Col]TRT72949.1 MAG: hypothetical protein EWV68_01100 [Microcystis sp. M_QC_C_20170808_M9Col]
MRFGNRRPFTAVRMSTTETYLTRIAQREQLEIQLNRYRLERGLFSTLCDNFCLWNREMLTGQDF